MSFVPWDDAPLWQRQTNIKGVQFRLDNPGCGPIEMHNSWMEEKIAAGWIHGEKKDAEKKTHPCLLPYSHLPAEQQMKDTLFSAIVDALKGQLE